MAQAVSQTVNLTELSVIVPIYNEEESIKPLCERLLSVLDEMGKPFEVIFVNDGSSDNSFSLLQDAAKERIELKIVNFRRNYGQTAATMAGIDHASGEVIIPIDADLQNDPADIPKLLGKLAEGYDVVSGWRKDRQDAAIRRNFVSRLANRLISKISGVHLHDYGCTLKAYKKDVVKGIRLYGEMHRFIPIYATWMGAKVCEIPVQHHARQFGQSKYGLERIAKVLLDLMVVKFLDRHMVKPIYVFGGIGLVSFFASFLSTIWMLWLKFFENTSMIQTPLPLVVTMTFLVGVMCILLGLLAEMIVRTYFESQGRSPYLVKETVNMEQE
ncbi:MULTISPECIES: glycosyltransferase family 2 protein [Thalassospira]|uniref:Glycosyltransferase involved in cell wall biosynthesis n=1 Tax=Thalassospira tepidiphila TaxID=393657 RepID=A0ABX0X3G1_9PROT|nr:MULTISPECIES: glycosyltransferase family 2 protein [Thalassospira]MBE70893.1 glycosyltransferase [Thalassospira sp.]NJB76124.1 glycosyltransferase involved in cell wall biosynthesis [Thalassospira tepidiphila]